MPCGVRPVHTGPIGRAPLAAPIEPAAGSRSYLHPSPEARVRFPHGAAWLYALFDYPADRDLLGFAVCVALHHRGFAVAHRSPWRTSLLLLYRGSAQHVMWLHTARRASNGWTRRFDGARCVKPVSQSPRSSWGSCFEEDEHVIAAWLAANHAQ